MLVLPIINHGRILKVEVRLKQIKKVKNSVKYIDVEESDIIVNNISFKTSKYNTKSMDLSDITNFIRINNINKKDYFISTKINSNKDLYDIYQVANPPILINKSLDRLYASIVLDLKNEIPDNNKGRFIDLEKLGFSNYLTDDRLKKLHAIANKKLSSYKKEIENEGLGDLVNTINFLKRFEFTIIKSSSIKVDEYEKLLKVLNTTNTEEAKAMNKYYSIAINNTEIYKKLVKLNSILYNESLDLIKSNKKVEE